MQKKAVSGRLDRAGHAGEEILGWDPVPGRQEGGTQTVRVALDGAALVCVGRPIWPWRSLSKSYVTDGRKNGWTRRLEEVRG